MNGGARLRHVRAGEAGIRRIRSGRGFRYTDARGKPVRAAATLQRIRALAIPPAWDHVWICADERGHIQATGRDARGRKQYRYHPLWRASRDEDKFARLTDFAASLPRLRAKVRRDLARPGLGRECVLATVVRLLERTLIRVGNDEYARTNGSFGLTTMRGRHVDVEGVRIRFRFKGKSGKTHEVDATDPQAARIVRRCARLPGHELFEYLDEDGKRRDVQSGDVNDYLREATRHEFTAKDFRTWAGTVIAGIVLGAADPPETDAEATRAINAAVDEVAAALGNTRAIARNSYVHPAIVEAYRDGTLASAFGRRTRRIEGLSKAETIVARVLAAREDAAAARSA